MDLGPISLPTENDTIEREVARGSNVEELSMQVNGERESKEKDENQMSKEEGTNEQEPNPPNPINQTCNLLLQDLQKINPTNFPYENSLPIYLTKISSYKTKKKKSYSTHKT